MRKSSPSTSRNSILWRLDALGECVEQSLPAERLVVDADDLHSVGKAGPVTDSAGDDLGDGSISAERQADRIQGRNSAGIPGSGGSSARRVLASCIEPCSHTGSRLRAAAHRAAGRLASARTTPSRSRPALAGLSRFRPARKGTTLAVVGLSPRNLRQKSSRLFLPCVRSRMIASASIQTSIPSK